MTDLCVRLVGAVTVCRDGRCHTGRELGSRKARTLVALLGVQRGRLVTTARLAEALWGDAPPQRPAANIATMVSRLRATVGSDVVAGGRSGYRLGDHVRTDLGDAVALLSEAQARLAAGSARRALAVVARTLTLLGDGMTGGLVGAGPAGEVVLTDQPDTAWTQSARLVHREMLRRSRHTAARAALRVADHVTAVALSRAAVAADPFDEAACRILMQAHCAAAEPGRALRAYEQLRTTLARELGCDPARTTQDLHVAILRDNRCRSELSA
jgi:DNA-binding SARP family transcriptional activator